MVDLKSLKELTKNLKVLYVEDDVSIGQTMVQYLEKFFSVVVYAINGLEGLQKYQLQKFDIVITDLSMPKMNGLDMLEQIKELNESQAVLITTAHSESDYMFGAIKAGIDGYIIKPFDFIQLNRELFKISQKLQKFSENEKYKSHLQEMVEKKTSELRHLVDFQNDNYEKTLFSMVEMIEQRDTYTAGHSKRVADYSQKIAREMGFSEEDCIMIHQAGILHDVGKIATPDAVLLNPNTLTDVEYKLIQEHVEVSYRLLNNIPMFKALAEIVHSHHERFDGKGYPLGLKGNDIIPLARIMIVADAFDAMTTNRIYKAKKSVKEALGELVELSSKQFHPEVVEVALIALKDVEIDENITQLPKSKLEEERFAYFYKDTLSEAYNQNYLDVVLMKNSYDAEYKNIEVFLLKDFSKYNKNNGWQEGDKFLKKIASMLCEKLSQNLVFRVFGDDFVVVSKEKIELLEIEKSLDSLMENTKISYRVKSIDLDKVSINKITQIENV
ncbi:MAG: response regulator [Sulfurimonas sp.]|nr:response regulator [Sulfurimonas sp.]